MPPQASKSSPIPARSSPLTIIGTSHSMTGPRSGAGEVSAAAPPVAWFYSATPVWFCSAVDTQMVAIYAVPEDQILCARWCLYR